MGCSTKWCCFPIRGVGAVCFPILLMGCSTKWWCFPDGMLVLSVCFPSCGWGVVPRVMVWSKCVYPSCGWGVDPCVLPCVCVLPILWMGCFQVCVPILWMGCGAWIYIYVCAFKKKKKKRSIHTCACIKRKRQQSINMFCYHVWCHSDKRKRTCMA